MKVIHRSENLLMLEDRPRFIGIMMIVLALAFAFGGSVMLSSGQMFGGLMMLLIGVGTSTDSEGTTYRMEIDLRDPPETVPLTTYYTSGNRPDGMAWAVNDWLGVRT